MESEWKCPKCGLFFKNKRNYERHIFKLGKPCDLTIREEKQISKINKKDDFSINLQDLIVDKRKDNAAPYQCTLCGRNYASDKYLKTHIEKGWCVNGHKGKELMQVLMHELCKNLTETNKKIIINNNIVNNITNNITNNNVTNNNITNSNNTTTINNDKVENFCSNGNINKSITNIVGDNVIQNTNNIEDKRHIENVINLEDNRNIQNNLVINERDVRINAFGKENLEAVTEEFMDEVVNDPERGIVRLIKFIHFNPELPENRNVIIKNKKDPFFNVFNGKKWEKQSKDETIHNLLTTKKDIMDDHYEQMEERNVVSFFLRDNYGDFSGFLDPMLNMEFEKQIKRIAMKYTDEKSSKECEKLYKMLYNQVIFGILEDHDVKNMEKKRISLKK